MKCKVLELIELVPSCVDVFFGEVKVRLFRVQISKDQFELFNSGLKHIEVLLNLTLSEFLLEVDLHLV